MSEHNSPLEPQAGTLIQSPEQVALMQADVRSNATVPGFTIESTIGRGGMGVVYKATQAGLNRTVALKMLLAGGFADPATRARFLLEAESVAALEHPHIVHVFAFGEHTGYPYLAMEYVPGGTLADRVKANGTLAAKEAAEITAKLAAAVAHAHSRGVVHRDIKPLNVLLAADGEPRLADFGLAKVGRADQHLSVTGQVLGTPAYMSPEQAAGKTHEIGTATDVYALGAVLYDVLTGQPPFQGDSVAVTLQKVIAEEPRRPRHLNTSIPRDLETICLKCLEKDAAKRYPTAQELADDLLRYLRGQPIAARPTGTLERGYKWVKRNTVVAGAVTAVSLALLVGAGVSVNFGLEARKQAEVAKQKQKDADDAREREEGEKQIAIVARDDLKQSNEQLKQSEERYKRMFGKALLGPISAKEKGRPLTPQELESFWGVAELRRDQVAWKFFEEATRTPLACEQLECRVEYLAHAMIGLDTERRDALDRFLLKRLRDKLEHDQLVSLAQACSRWGNASPATAAQAAAILVAAPNKETDFDARERLAGGLSAVAGRMDPVQAADILVAALNAQILLEALPGSQDSSIRESLVDGLSAVAGRMDPVQAAKVCAQAADILVAALNKEKNSGARKQLAERLSAVVGRMDPVQAADILVTALNKETYPGARKQLAVGLSAVAGRMDPVQAAKVYREVVDILLAAMNNCLFVTEGRNPKWSDDIRLAESFSAFLSGISPQDRESARNARIHASCSFATPHNLLPSLPLLLPTSNPRPKPLPPQTLVELLKHPLCVGEARRIVLDALEYTYQQSFKDQWEFVEYARKHQPQLDLLTPPKRPTGELGR